MTSEFVDGSWQVGTTPAQDEPQKSAVTPWDEGTRIYGSQAFESWPVPMLRPQPSEGHFVLGP